MRSFNPEGARIRRQEEAFEHLRTTLRTALEHQDLGALKVARAIFDAFTEADELELLAMLGRDADRKLELENKAKCESGG